MVSEKMLMMMPMFYENMEQSFEEYSDNFKAVLSTSHLDELGNYVKTDPIILMIGVRSPQCYEKEGGQKNIIKGICARTNAIDS